MTWTRPSHRTGYDDDYLLKDAADEYHASYGSKYDLYSPTTKRKMISKLERRLSELRESSESMALKLGRAERTLRDLKLEDAKQTTIDDTLSDDGLFQNDITRHRHRNTSDRDALRLEIARLREDLRLLRRDTSTTSAVTGFDDTLNLPRNYVSRDDDYAYGGTHRRYRDGYNTAANDNLLEVRRSRTVLDDADYSRYRVDAPFVSPSTCCSGTGLRSSFSRPIITQHNRMRMTSPTYNQRWSDGFDTTDRRTFKPYGPRDLNIGDVVKFRRSLGKMERGRVMYIGHLPGKSEAFLGIELESNTGNHDGMHNGFRYFQCKPNRGLFIPFDNVVLAWGNTVHC